MMPQLVTVRVQRRQGRLIRLWIPLLPVVLLLSPVLILAALVVVIACVAYRLSPVRALGSGWRLWCALPGTRVDIQQGRVAVLVNIR
jgi:hypothetical protein